MMLLMINLSQKAQHEPLKCVEALKYMFGFTQFQGQKISKYVVLGAKHWNVRLKTALKQ